MSRPVMSALVCVISLLPAVALAHPSPYRHFHMTYPELQAAIAKARVKLARAQVGTKEASGRHAVLAVWDPDGDRSDIRLVHVRNGVSKTKGFVVKALPWNGLPPRPGVEPYNGVNTRYAIMTPANFYVLALKTNTRSRPGAIYVPYSPAYQTPETVRAGRAYLESVIRAAEARIVRQKVRSTLDPSKLVTDALDAGASGKNLDADARVAMTLLVIEHIDVSEFDARGAAWTADKVLTMLALDREDTYRYAVSSAGAGGIAQFIPPTYRDIRLRYPEAKLPVSFEDAMRDHVTAVTAQFCLMDRALKALIDSGQEIPRGRMLTGAYLAASYNAGEHRAIPALREHRRRCGKRYSGSWCKSGHGLPSETAHYVREFADVYRHLFGH